MLADVGPYVPAATCDAVIFVVPGFKAVTIPVFPLVVTVAIVGSLEVKDQAPVELDVGALMVKEFVDVELLV